MRISSINKIKHHCLIVAARRNVVGVNVKIFVFFVMLLVSNVGFSSSVGLGVSLNNSSSVFGYDLVTPAILIPIEIGQSVIIEPFFSTNTFKTKSDFRGNYKVADDTIGMGVYGYYTLGNSIRQYVGAKLTKTMVGVTDSEYSYEIDVLELTPLVGFQYDATKSMSAAFELGLSFADGDYTNCCDSTLNETIEAQSLYVGLTLRYLFFK